MREIKFRAWDKARNIYDNTMLSFAGNYVAEWGRLEVEQFTGLHDKNGKEIYEGDIVVDEDDIYAPIEYNNGCFWYGALLLFDRHNTVIISGNIHENKEILK